MPFESSNKAVVSSLLWGDRYWLEQMFDVPHYAIKRANVDALFLSLAATKLANICRQPVKVVWTLTWTDKSITGFESDEYWDGVTFFSDQRLQQRRTGA